MPTTYHRTHGIRHFHGCYSPGDYHLWGVTRRRKGGDHSLAALKSIRAARRDGAPIYVIMGSLSANKTPAIRAWAKKSWSTVKQSRWRSGSERGSPTPSRRGKLTPDLRTALVELGVEWA